MFEALGPVWKKVKVFVGTEFTPGTGDAAGAWTYSPLCQGIEGATPAANEQNQQLFFMCQDGFAVNVVTGAAPQIDITGRRIEGDAAQDYIVSKQFSLGDERMTSVKIINGAKQIVCDATIGSVVGFGGQALDVDQFSCTLYFNGKPTVTDAE